MAENEYIDLNDKGFNDWMKDIEREALVDLYGEEEGNKLADEDDSDIDITEDMPTDEELDSELDKLLDDEIKAFEDEPELSDKEVAEKYGIDENGNPIK